MLGPLKAESRESEQLGVAWSKRGSSVEFMTFMRDLVAAFVVRLTRFLTWYMNSYSFSLREKTGCSDFSLELSSYFSFPL